jgi:hypothetical protein
MSEKKKLEAYYGLPEEIRFCTKCVMSNQRPTSAIEFKHTKDSKKTTMNFDEDGVCDACRTAEIKDNIYGVWMIEAIGSFDIQFSVEA